MVGKKRFRKTATVLAAAGFAATAAHSPALAHPHAWIDASTELHLNDRQELTAITVHWVFDPAYSNFATEGLDKDGDGVYSADELRPLAEQNLKALAEYSYFTEVTVNGEQVGYGEPKDFSSSYNDLQLAMTFTLPLAEPVYVKTNAISYAMFDPSYYVEILHKTQDPIAIRVQGKANCAPELMKPDLDSLPISMAEMSEPSFAEEPAEGDMSYGEMFAERVHLICN